MDSNSNGGLILVALIAAVVIFGNGPATPTPGPGPNAVVVSEAMRKHVTGLQSVMATAQPGPKGLIAKGFADLAEVLELNPGVISTTDQLSRITRDTSSILSRAASLKGTVPGFSAAVEQSLTSAFGTDTMSVKHSDAVDFIRSLAWACGG
jgi:hypothetical protein